MPLLTDQSSRKTQPFTGPAAEPPRSVSSGTAARRPHQVGYNLGSRRAAVASARGGRAQLIGCSVRRAEVTVSRIDGWRKIARALSQSRPMTTRLDIITLFYRR